MRDSFDYSKAMSSSGFRHHITLILTTILHAFTHAYGSALVPLYLLMVADLKLTGVRAASLIVTIYGLVYCLGSYAAGVLADRFNRKILLGIGLLGNALAFIAIGLTRQYEMVILLAILGGIFGTLFHPAANALIPAHYPKAPGMAIGMLGIGSGFGFFFGPQYAGWRAQTASWHFGLIADWQRPCVELGIFGVVAAILFLIFARDVKLSPDREKTEDAMLPNRVAMEAIVTDIRGEHDQHHFVLSASLKKRVIAVAAVLGCRDFAGLAVLSLLSIYLQKAHGYSTKQAGFVIGGMMLLSVIVNPFAVYLSPGKRRLPTLVALLIMAGVLIAIVPLVRIGWVLPLACLFECFQLGSYAVSDAAILERVSSRLRGRVYGLFLMLAGTFASLSPWVMGFWTDLLKNQAHEPRAYLPIFGTLGAMMIVACFSTPLIDRLSEREPATRLTRPVAERILKNFG